MMMRGGLIQILSLSYLIMSRNVSTGVLSGIFYQPILVKLMQLRGNSLNTVAPLIYTENTLCICSMAFALLLLLYLT